MSEIQNDDPRARQKRDRQRLKKISIRHGALALAALTLWGTADAWATSSGWMLAEIVALLNAIFGGVVIAYLAHEWGHFAGARWSGAVSPVLKEPRSFFMFNFRYDLNTRGQFLAMSMGGPTANWLLFILLFIMLPLDTASQALLQATVFGVAVSVSVFEFPVINQVMYGKDPKSTVDQRSSEVGYYPRNTGAFAGLLFWLLAA